MSNIGSIEEWQQIAKAQQNSSDDGVFARFYPKAVEDKPATEREGKVVHKTVDYVEIRIAGQPRSVVNREAHDGDKNRFAAEWARYEAGKGDAPQGTPIEQWPYLNVARVADLRAAGVFTVEQLAAVSDGNLGQLGIGARDLRKRAQQHLQGAGETERELREELAERDNTISNLEARMRQLEARLEELAEEKPKRGPGRPRREAA